MIEISKGNSKTGPSFSIPAGKTCPGKTATCAASCYVNFGRMALPVSKDKRERNLQAVIDATKNSTLWAELRDAIKYNSIATLRIHDSGDFFSPAYAKSWWNACRVLPKVSF